MSIFDDRERDEETRFKHSLWLDFKARARRNKLFGLWVAERMGLGADEAKQYATELVMIDFTEPGDDDVVGKVAKDLEAHGTATDEVVLRHKYSELFEHARLQVKGE